MLAVSKMEVCDPYTYYEDRFGEKTVFVGLLIKIPDIHGKFYCTVCNCLVSYGSCGKIAWTE